jgi:hypothetical protein
LFLSAYIARLKDHPVLPIPNHPFSILISETPSITLFKLKYEHYLLSSWKKSVRLASIWVNNHWRASTMQEVMNWIDREVERLDREIKGEELEDNVQNPVPELLKDALGRLCLTCNL